MDLSALPPNADFLLQAFIKVNDAKIRAWAHRRMTGANEKNVRKINTGVNMAKSGVAFATILSILWRGQAAIDEQPRPVDKMKALALFSNSVSRPQYFSSGFSAFTESVSRALELEEGEFDDDLVETLYMIARDSNRVFKPTNALHSVIVDSEEWRKELSYHEKYKDEYDNSWIFHSNLMSSWNEYNKLYSLRKSRGEILDIASKDLEKTMSAFDKILDLKKYSELSFETKVKLLDSLSLYPDMVMKKPLLRALNATFDEFTYPYYEQTFTGSAEDDLGTLDPKVVPMLNNIKGVLQNFTNDLFAGTLDEFIMSSGGDASYIPGLLQVFSERTRESLELEVKEFFELLDRDDVSSILSIESRVMLHTIYGVPLPMSFQDEKSTHLMGVSGMFNTLQLEMTRTANEARTAVEETMHGLQTIDIADMAENVQNLVVDSIRKATIYLHKQLVYKMMGYQKLAPLQYESAVSDEEKEQLFSDLEGVSSDNAMHKSVGAAVLCLFGVVTYMYMSRNKVPSERDIALSIIKASNNLYSLEDLEKAAKQYSEEGGEKTKIDFFRHFNELILDQGILHNVYLKEHKHVLTGLNKEDKSQPGFTLRQLTKFVETVFKFEKTVKLKQMMQRDNYTPFNQILLVPDYNTITSALREHFKVKEFLPRLKWLTFGGKTMDISSKSLLYIYTKSLCKNAVFTDKKSNKKFPESRPLLQMIIMFIYIKLIAMSKTNDSKLFLLQAKVEEDDPMTFAYPYIFNSIRMESYVLRNIAIEVLKLFQLNVYTQTGDSRDGLRAIQHLSMHNAFSDNFEECFLRENYRNTLDKSAFIEQGMFAPNVFYGITFEVSFSKKNRDSIANYKFKLSDDFFTHSPEEMDEILEYI